MNAEDALAAIEEVEKSPMRGKERAMIGEDEKGSGQIVKMLTEIKGKTIKPFGW